MSLKDPDNEDTNWYEHHHQAHIVAWLREQKALKKLSFDIGMEGIRIKPYQIMQAKKQGMDKGVPDLKIKLPEGKLIHIELKRWKGTVSQPQKDEHTLLESLGHTVYIVKEKTPQQALNRVKELIAAHIIV